MTQSLPITITILLIIYTIFFTTTISSHLIFSSQFLFSTQLIPFSSQSYFMCFNPIIILCNSNIIYNLADTFLIHYIFNHCTKYEIYQYFVCMNLFIISSQCHIYLGNTIPQIPGRLNLFFLSIPIKALLAGRFSCFLMYCCNVFTNPYYQIKLFDTLLRRISHGHLKQKLSSSLIQLLTISTKYLKPEISQDYCNKWPTPHRIVDRSPPP